MTEEEFAEKLGEFLTKEVAIIRVTLPYKTGLLSGRTGTGGFHLERTETGFRILIDESKVFYAKYVNDENWRSPKTGLPKRTAGFWRKLVKDRLIADLEAWLKENGTY